MVNIELLLGNHRIWYDLYDFSPPLVDEIDSLDQFPSGYTWDTNGWKRMKKLLASNDPAVKRKLTDFRQPSDNV